MPYYRIVTLDEGMNIMMKRDSHKGIFHTNGTSIKQTEIELPFKVKMYAGEEYGYDQYDPDFEGEFEELTIEERLADFYSESALMSPKLVDALKSVGVENIQVFPVEIKDAETEELVEVPYFFVNVVGVVACADLSASDSAPLGDGYYFHKLKINEKDTNDLLMFRLAESHLEIIVEEKVAKVINSGEFKGIEAVLCS